MHLSRPTIIVRFGRSMCSPTEISKILSDGSTISVAKCVLSERMRRSLSITVSIVLEHLMIIRFARSACSQTGPDLENVLRWVDDKRRKLCCK
jgi:hypothetical protein